MTLGDGTYQGLLYPLLCNRVQKDHALTYLVVPIYLPVRSSWDRTGCQQWPRCQSFNRGRHESYYPTLTTI